MKKICLFIALAVIIVYAIIQDWRLGGGADPQKTDSGIAIVNGREVKIEYVSQKSLAPAFGSSSNDLARVREDLSPRTKRFVRAHELYHLGDQAKWGGWLGKEMFANIIPGLVDPVGLCSTIIASLNKERLTFYWERFKRGW